MNNIAIIPARSGSKRLKDKNIKPIKGKPLIAYTIEAALESKVFDKVVVSTDSAIYADIAKEFGAEVPFLRYDYLSTDSTSSWDVVINMLDYYKKNGIEFENVALLQPTSPLRTSDDILKGFHEFKIKDANAIVSVCEVDHSPLWCNTLPDDHSLKGFIAEDILNKTSQELPKYYRINGALYIFKTSELESVSNLYVKGSYAIIMDKIRSIDIDDEYDFKIAEAILTIE